MRARITAVLAAALLLLASATVAFGWPLDQMNTTINQTNFIVNRGCSGTLISLKEKLILTNHHCINDALSMIEREETQKDGSVKKVKREKREDVMVGQRAYQGYKLVGSSEYVAEIVFHRKNRDLALLRLKADTIPHTAATTVLPMGKTVTRGEPVYVVGNPGGLDATVVTGIVSSTSRTFEFSWLDGEEVAFTQFSGGVWFGNSGGALYNDAGYLIGVPAVIVGTAHLGLAISVDTIRGFLKEAGYGPLVEAK